jgi:hypothetical protein
VRKRRLCFIALSLVLNVHALPVWAGQQSASHAVTIQVPQTLSIKADVSAFTLTMRNFIAGSDSNTVTVNYTLRSTNNTAADGATLMKAKLNTAFGSIDFFADPGRYDKNGGNASLTEQQSGIIKILTTDTNLAKKTNVTGNGKIIRGVLPVSYKAIATADLDSQSQRRVLTVTFTDT